MPEKKAPVTAVILVGGEGTRLRPLTNSVPKSMVPVLNQPFLEHTIAYLKEYGIGHIILTLSYHPEIIQNYFKDGRHLKTRLTYCIEDSPLGTAGAVKNTEQYLDNAFFVLNGDIFTDLDLSGMLSFHRRQKAKVTIALTWVDNPCAFGVVETGTDGKIQRFIEKPSPDRVTTNWINAGVYIIEPEVLKHVPAGSHYMFENGLFPLLLKLNEPVYGYQFKGYWLDMGTPEKYLCLNCDLLLSKAKSNLINNLDKDKIISGQEAIVHPSAKITGPAIISSKCWIGPGVHIKGPVIMAPDCCIGEDAVLEEAVLWEKVNIGRGAILKQCVVGSNTRIKDSDRVINRVVTS